MLDFMIRFNFSTFTPDVLVVVRGGTLNNDNSSHQCMLKVFSITIRSCSTQKYVDVLIVDVGRIVGVK